MMRVVVDQQQQGFCGVEDSMGKVGKISRDYSPASIRTPHLLITMPLDRGSQTCRTFWSISTTCISPMMAGRCSGST